MNFDNLFINNDKSKKLILKFHLKFHKQINKK